MIRSSESNGWNRKAVLSIIGLVFVAVGAASTILAFSFQSEADAKEHEGKFNGHVQERTVLDLKQDLIDDLQNDNDKEYKETLKELQNIQTNIRENIIKLMTEQGMRRKVVPLLSKDTD